MKQIGSLTVSMVSMENRPPFAMGMVDVGGIKWENMHIYGAI